MQIRTIVLPAATVAVLGALLVLFFRVRSEPEVEIPEAALAQARAEYERSQSRSEVEAFQANRGDTPARPLRRPPVTEPAPSGSGGSGDEVPLTRPAVRRSVSNVRAASDSPAAAGVPSAPPSSDDAKEPVRNAYQQNDFSTALELSEKYLSEFPGDPYVLRVAGVSACATGEDAIARKYFALMTATDQAIVSRRCGRYGIELQQP